MKNWCFWTVVLEKTLESPLDCKDIQHVNPTGNQSWVFIEGRMLKLKLHYLGHLMQRTDSLEKTLMLGKTEGRSRKRWERMRWLDGITHMIDMTFSRLLVLVMDQEAWRAAVHGSQRVGHDWRTELILSKWYIWSHTPEMDTKGYMTTVPKCYLVGKRHYLVATTDSRQIGQIISICKRKTCQLQGNVYMPEI